ncbi:uncharacterized protein BDR25DRAFT_370992 [Lindgomyces ingoldianus]|uniref:Uncharacterized protein n=1 Tax=Lindgomyces ingoldianus TaxID=673940 RepID=A0ACB6RD85_9PLEO|nr:uncharacterized protein BDR25DRAFT_370992 [Lindgomyces ingoldianus]KAF2477062.1 hypothetical protein BDR25DRAFT_370992 [Lindgomyces ingoldianus]
MLPSRVALRWPLGQPPSPEDIFSSAPNNIFTNDLQNQHGDDPYTIVVYKNQVHGELEFRTADVNGEERGKFAHCLWNAGILMAELVGGRETEGKGMSVDRGNGVYISGEEANWGIENWWVSKEEEHLWSVRGETVLELGAGVGLAGIMSVLSGAEKVAITDYPIPAILDAIQGNVCKNIEASLWPLVSIGGHKWGCLDTPFAKDNAHGYTRILAADCLWVTNEHKDLVRSMLHFLSPSPDARIFCIAGFHTGRTKVAMFFEEVVPESGLEIEELLEMDVDGKRREWRRERDGGTEHIGERNKWLVVARLKQSTR